MISRTIASKLLRIFTVAIILISIIASCVLVIPPKLSKISAFAWDMIYRQLDKEEEEMNRKIANHEVVRGKDTKLIWGKHYDIAKFSDKYHFSITSKESDGIILHSVTRFGFYDDCLYIISDEGKAIVNEDEHCRAYAIAPDLITNSNEQEKSYIEFLNSYSDFSQSEQKNFEKLNSNIWSFNKEVLE